MYSLKWQERMWIQMNKLFSLIKVEIIHGYSINKLSKKKNSNRKLGPFIATIILSLFLIGFVTFYAIMIGSICKQTNNLDFLFEHDLCHFYFQH